MPFGIINSLSALVPYDLLNVLYVRQNLSEIDSTNSFSMDYRILENDYIMFSCTISGFIVMFIWKGTFCLVKSPFMYSIVFL